MRKIPTVLITITTIHKNNKNTDEDPELWTDVVILETTELTSWS
jgi:hypothetical protein